jgi:hypothetical protein
MSLTVVVVFASPSRQVSGCGSPKQTYVFLTHFQPLPPTFLHIFSKNSIKRPSKRKSLGNRGDWPLTVSAWKLRAQGVSEKKISVEL